MKALLAPALLFLGLPLLAQTSSTTSSATTTTATAPAASAPAASTPSGHPSPTSMMDQVMSVLTTDERTQLTSARNKAMTNNPSLQTEEMDLMQKGMAMQTGEATDADKQAFHNEIKAHADKVRAAMIKTDPTVEPIIQKVEAQVAKLRAQYQGAH